MGKIALGLVIAMLANCAGPVSAMAQSADSAFVGEWAWHGEWKGRQVEWHLLLTPEHEAKAAFVVDGQLAGHALPGEWGVKADSLCVWSSPRVELMERQCWRVLVLNKDRIVIGAHLFERRQ